VAVAAAGGPGWGVRPDRRGDRYRLRL